MLIENLNYHTHSIKKFEGEKIERPCDLNFSQVSDKEIKIFCSGIYESQIEKIKFVYQVEFTIIYSLLDEDFLKQLHKEKLSVITKSLNESFAENVQLKV